MIYEYIIRLREWYKINILLVDHPWRAYFKEGEIWWCSIGLNIGDEEYGKGPLFQRPVLVFKKFTQNSFLGLPLTSKYKEGSWYATIMIKGNRNSIILNQARIFDKARLLKRMNTIGGTDFKVVKERFRKLYCP